MKRSSGRLGGRERGAVVASGGLEAAGGKHACQATKRGRKTGSTGGGGGGGVGEREEGQEGEKICWRRRGGRRWGGADGQGAGKHAEDGTRQGEKKALMKCHCCCAVYYVSYRVQYFEYVMSVQYKILFLLLQSSSFFFLWRGNPGAPTQPGGLFPPRCCNFSVILAGCDRKKVQLSRKRVHVCVASFQPTRPFMFIFSNKRGKSRPGGKSQYIFLVNSRLTYFCFVIYTAQRASTPDDKREAREV